MDHESFGEHVAHAREQHGYSIRQLAKRLNVASSTISRLETGARPLPQPDLVLALITHLDLDAVTAVSLLQPYQRLTQATLPTLADYLRTKYHMRRKDITELTHHAHQLGYDTKNRK
jgi:transcriptional regulator with XRE-family HTH domain